MRSREDADTIAQSLGVSAETIRRAMRGGNCTVEVFTAVTEFYAIRQKKVKKLLSPLELKEV